MNSKIHAFNINIDPVTMDQAVNIISGWIEDKNETDCHYVVTPNVDHLTKLCKDKKFRTAYACASMVLTDGKPVYYALKLLGKPVPEIVPGSDLVPSIFDKWQKNKRKLNIFLLGAAPGVAKEAAKNIKKKWSFIEIVGVHSPPPGFENQKEENKKILKKIAACSPDLLIIGLGAPKQEVWIHTHNKQINASVALCVGATIDFLAGQQKRAPLWMRRFSLEWVYRMAKDPKRLGKRYGVNLLMFPCILWKEWLSG